MRHHLAAVVGSLVAAVLLAPGLSPGQGPAAPGAAAEAIKWDLKRLNQEPFKLIRATPDPQGGQVRFVLELTRPARLGELFDWERAGGPAVFRFLDEDGVVLKTIKPRLEGEMVPNQGARIRLLLSLPDEKILELTRSVVADN
jgi:hypothetical protein